MCALPTQAQSNDGFLAAAQPGVPQGVQVSPCTAFPFS